VPGHQQAGLQELGTELLRGPEQEVDPGVLQVVDVPSVVDVAESVLITPAQRTVVDVAVLTSAVIIHTAIIASGVLPG
jgi:hypothetical protein